ncbi:xanthine dehydrogenase family protein molybdopterin-binding subunit [Deinococcus sp. KSM4-11]|uniref:xanthine dehydrogenase family protein molybdopterin-binding subunit n=1 Tax=Deinococcus sp. KSM4-11 TaxID=2568654 RepID=UPI0010A3CD63|nr:xanthine dehydrogenase family protein molybdopterin-binding subunit [Deinococcus sp. KSM4-11]THF84309.1 xanthine dehydrogenase family protein molybdopterin-binding subunit [Deinococcus sp. KSM4-11]
MKFDQAATPNPIDQERVVTRPHTRIEGPLKVTGQAPYAYEYDLPVAPTYGFVLGAGIAHGRITRIDTALAEAAPGVLLVLTHETMPAQGKSDTPVPQQEEASPQLTGPEVRHYHQAVAFVVAQTFEQARAAASLIEVDYEVTPGQYTLADTVPGGQEPEDAVDSVVGNFDHAYRKAEVTVDLTYTTPDQSQAPMEPHATIAHWEGEQLTVYTAHQVVHWVKRGLALTLNVPQKNVRVISAYVGGGFGTKLLFFSDAVLSAAAARLLGRPVKTALARPLIFNHTSHRAATIQHLRLGADPTGHLSAVGHDTWTGNLPGGDTEPACEQTKYLYAGPHRQIRTRKTELDLPPGASMRAPGEAVGMLALEGAMDELAEKLGIDPVELRLRNDVQFDPEKGPKRPFSSRRLAQALRTGARAFGWENRPRTPKERRDGEWFVGYGVASAFRTNLVKPSGATVRLEPGGTLTVETQMTDIGTGSYTILGQVAAEMLGLELAQVQVRLGDSDYPAASGSGGSWGANSASAGVYAACDDLRRALVRQAGYTYANAVFRNGQVWQGAECTPLADLAGTSGVSATGRMTYGDLDEQYVQAGFGAHFLEVHVNAYTAEIRVRRALSVVAAGRILNPITARSQCLGGMTMGIGSALMEALHVDHDLGLFVNHDLAEYHVPVHADIPDMDVIFLDELDDQSSPLRAKGLGELGISGVGAAVASAVYNASGVRVRDFPITLDKVLAGWEGQG